MPSRAAPELARRTKTERLAARDTLASAAKSPSEKKRLMPRAEEEAAAASRRQPLRKTTTIQSCLVHYARRRGRNKLAGERARARQLMGPHLLLARARTTAAAAGRWFVSSARRFSPSGQPAGGFGWRSSSSRRREMEERIGGAQGMAAAAVA